MSSMFDNPAILRELIMDHYKFPRNKGLVLLDNYKNVHMASDSCIDDITVESLIENGVIKDIKFDGVGCTISTASTSMMSELLINKTITQAKEIIENYFNMVEDKPYNPDILQEAISMKNVYKQANRIKCATIGWKAIRKMILESENNDE